MAEHLILIIDDNESEALIAKRVLSRLAPCIRVEIIFSGKQGLEFLRSDKPIPALILLDLKMPGMGGIEFLRRLRADGGLNKLPVIVVTNSALEADQRESLETGANGFLRKAFDMDQFQSDIAAVLKRWLKN